MVVLHKMGCLPPFHVPSVLSPALGHQRSKRNIIGYFETKDSDGYHTFEKVANILRDDCAFFAAFG